MRCKAGRARRTSSALLRFGVKSDSSRIATAKIANRKYAVAGVASFGLDAVSESKSRRSDGIAFVELTPMLCPGAESYQASLASMAKESARKHKRKATAVFRHRRQAAGKSAMIEFYHAKTYPGVHVFAAFSALLISY